MIHPMKKTAAAWCGGEDFLIQILVRLPVTSLLRFKSVCKSWRALIQTSYFIHLHTTTTTSNSSKFGTFILQAEQYQYGQYSMKNAILVLSSEPGSESEYGDWYWGTDGSWHKFTGSGGGSNWHWDDTCGYWVNDDDDDDQKEVFKVNDDDDDQLVLQLQNFGLLSCYKLFSREVMAGSCNGLICLYDSHHRTVSLWNPATRQFRHLPKSMTIEKKIGYLDFVGFGFDVKTKDYKVVQISCFSPTYRAQWQPGCICGVHVYSLSTDSWRLLEGINLLPGLPMVGLENHGLYLNGSSFFVGTKITSELPSDNRLLLSFDFTEEIFTTMQFPDHNNRQNLVLSCLGEKLALFTTTTTNSSNKKPSVLVGPGPGAGGDQYPSSRSYEDYDIWVWNEHRACSSVNKESWTKLHSFRIKNRGGGAFERTRTIPRGISNNGEFALIETTTQSRYYLPPGELTKKMQLFNLVTKEVKKDFLICDSVCRTDVYQQSLVSIIGGNDASTTSRSCSR